MSLMRFMSPPFRRKTCSRGMPENVGPAAFEANPREAREPREFFGGDSGTSRAIANAGLLRHRTRTNSRRSRTPLRLEPNLRVLVRGTSSGRYRSAVSGSGRQTNRVSAWMLKKIV